MLARIAGAWFVLCLASFADDAVPKLKWSTRIEGIKEGSAAVSGGEIFAPVVEGSAVVSVSALTGKLRWKTVLNDTSPFPPILDKDNVYVITGSCTLYSLSRADGKVVWSRWLAGQIESMPTLSGGMIYAASLETHSHAQRNGGWNLVCLDAAKGKEQWAYPLGADIQGAPLVQDGKLFVATQGGGMVGIDLVKKIVLWKRDSGAMSMPVPCKDWLIYRTNGGVEAANRKDGKVAWSWDGLKNDPGRHGGHEFRVPMISGDRLFVTVSATEIACVNLTDRSTQWTWSGGDETPGEPVMVGGRVYLGTSKGTVHSLDASSGKTIWSVKTDATISDAPAIMDGFLYFHDHKGGLVCVDAATPEATGWGMWGGSPAHAGPVVSKDPPPCVTPSASDQGK